MIFGVASIAAFWKRPYVLHRGVNLYEQMIPCNASLNSNRSYLFHRKISRAAFVITLHTTLSNIYCCLYFLQCRAPRRRIASEFLRRDAGVESGAGK